MRTEGCLRQAAATGRRSFRDRRGLAVNLLIVDDHAGMRALIRHLIGPLAKQVQECASGEEAVDLCTRFVPDCVTMDLRMGPMHGLAAVQNIRSAHPMANIIVVTQHDHDTLRARARRAGADNYITKDNLEALRRYVQSLATDLED